MAITDANLLLGRLLPSYFPKIFGPKENESLDAEATRKAFAELTKEINQYLSTFLGCIVVITEIQQAKEICRA